MLIYRHFDPNGKSYIGKTTRNTVEERITSNPLHAYAASSKFIEGIKEFGWENFTTEILEDNIQDEILLSEREEFYIKKYDSVNNGYNILHNNFKNFYKKKYKFTYEQLYELYVKQGLSTTEIADLYDTDHVSVYYQLKKHEIPIKSRGYMSKKAQEFYATSWKNNREEIRCRHCNELFLPKRKSQSFCSKGCLNMFTANKENVRKGQFGIHTLPPKERKRALSKQKKNMKGNKNGLGNRGGIVTSHNKHKNKYYHTLCEICKESTPEYVANSTWLPLEEVCKRVDLDKSDLIRILKLKNLYFPSKSVAISKEMGDAHIVIKTENISNRIAFLWNLEVIEKVIRNSKI